MSFWRNIPLLKRVYPSLRKSWAKRVWKNGFKVISFRGVTLLVRWQNMPERHIAFFGGYENKQVKMLFDLAKEREATLFLDIGSNVGYYSLLANEILKGIEIHAFEPDIKNHDQLRANILLNDAYNINIHHCAVGERDGVVRFNSIYCGGASIATEETEATIDAQIRKIDSIFNETKNKSVIIKIDVEGFELGVIQGMQNFLQNNKVVLQIEEFPDAPADVKNLLSSLGYSAVSVIGNDKYYKN